VQRGGDGDGAGDKDEHIRGVSPEHARRHRRVGRIRDLGSDIGAGRGELGELGTGPGDGDDRSAGRGERARDPSSQAAAGADDDGDPL
jgi:hypothetical protein